MSRKQLDELGALQRSVMEVIWDRGESTVHEVRDALSGDERQPAYTTVLSVLQKLEKSGWVDHRREGRNYVYRASRSRQQEGTSSLRSFMNRVFEGDPRLLLQHLLDDERLDRADLDAIRTMIDRKRKERRDDA
ncbi:MAG: BlaI/MecI/CopY family transcriptional regulator [Planctomycetota bacterium]